MAKITSGEQFLHERDTRFHASTEVEDIIRYLNANGEKIPNTPDKKIGAYLRFMSDPDYVNDGILSGDPHSIDRQIKERVIKEGDVSESYFALQRRIARQQGHGDIDLTTEMKRQLVEAIQADQRAGLQAWVEYLGGDDGSYPDWFKHYAWESVMKLGAYDKDSQEFKKRSRGTTAPFPELNREALAYVYTALDTSLRGDTDDIQDEKVVALLRNANFGKLYAHAILEASPDSPELRRSVNGSWKKYDQSHDPRTARRLSASLQGHGTGWCTAGESTAHAQLQVGDFYVYYSENTDAEHTIPRAAIRMQHGEVAEVRGINPDQNLESELADIVMDKLQDLPGGVEYQKKAEDMKHLSTIEAMLSQNSRASLTDKDLRFLYEFDTSIQGFGYARDPRVDELRAMRGEQDYPEITRLLPEVLRQQATTSFVVYEALADSLANVKRMDQDTFMRLFEQQEAQWHSRGVYDYLTREFIKSGARPNLIATPNIVVGWQDIRAIADAFGKDQPYPLSVDDETMYHQYTAAQLSGEREGATPLRFAIIPSKPSQELGYNTADQQREVLKDMQRRNPLLNLHVPSVLDAVTLWSTLRVHGATLTSHDAFESTYIRHFDLPDVRLAGRLPVVPDSYVNVDGEPYLDNSIVATATTRGWRWVKKLTTSVFPQFFIFAKIQTAST